LGRRPFTPPTPHPAADERLAALWENCKAAVDELPEQPPHVRRAVALARLQLDPLALLASLAGPRQELLSLALYDMQDALSEEDRSRVLEQQLITAANQVGRGGGGGGREEARSSCSSWRAAPPCEQPSAAPGGAPARGWRQLAGAWLQLAALLHSMHCCLRTSEPHPARPPPPTPTPQVGADINLMAAVPWRAHMLQFICGLGPRKAQHLLKTIQRHGGYLDARRKLLAGRGARRRSAGGPARAQQPGSASSGAAQPWPCRAGGTGRQAHSRAPHEPAPATRRDSMPACGLRPPASLATPAGEDDEDVELGVLGKRVFRAAAPFLKVRGAQEPRGPGGGRGPGGRGAGGAPWAGGGATWATEPLRPSPPLAPQRPQHGHCGSAPAGARLWPGGLGQRAHDQSGRLAHPPGELPAGAAGARAGPPAAGVAPAAVLLLLLLPSQGSPGQPASRWPVQAQAPHMQGWRPSGAPLPAPLAPSPAGGGSC
jgi:hypothetical protein